MSPARTFWPLIPREAAVVHFSAIRLGRARGERQQHDQDDFHTSMVADDQSGGEAA